MSTFGRRLNRSSFPSVRWQRQFAIACFSFGAQPPKYPLPLGDRDPSLTQCVIGRTSIPAKWHLNPSHGSSRAHECDTRQTDRPHHAETCVAITGIACAGAMPPNTVHFTLQTFTILLTILHPESADPPQKLKEKYGFDT